MMKLNFSRIKLPSFGYNPWEFDLTLRKIETTQKIKSIRTFILGSRSCLICYYILAQNPTNIIRLGQPTKKHTFRSPWKSFGF